MLGVVVAHQAFQHRGIRRARRDGSHADIAFILAQAIRYGVQRMLGGGVDDVVRMPTVAGSGVDVDDIAFGFPQGWQQLARQFGGGENVDVEMFAPVCRGGIVDGFLFCNRRGVHNNVDVLQAEDVSKLGARLCVVGKQFCHQIGMYRGDVGAFRKLIEACLVASQGVHDVVTRKVSSDLTAHTAGSPGDNGNLALLFRLGVFFLCHFGSIFLGKVFG